jgi:hypothetical protein
MPVSVWGHGVAQLVEALCYKPEGRGFGTKIKKKFPLVSLEFFIYIIRPAAIWTWDRLSL